MQNTFLVPECNLAELTDRVAKLNRRCVKLGLPEITVEKAPGVTKHRVNQLTINGTINGHVWQTQEQIDARQSAPDAAYLAKCFRVTADVMHWWNVTVTGQSPVVAGWEFVAVLSPLTTDDGETLNMVSALPGMECPSQYRTIVGHCDHCNAFRRRKETFVVREVATGNHKCVGRQCLKDFLGYNADPHTLASQAELLAQLGDLCGDCQDEEWGGGFRSGPRTWHLPKFLALTACRIRLFGWVSKTKARDDYDRGINTTPTAYAVLAILTPPGPLADRKEKEEWEKMVAMHEVTEADVKMSEDAIEWAKDISENDLETNNYLANCNLIARVGTTTSKTSGIACSIVSSYARTIEKLALAERQANRPVSQHVGVVGKRMEIATVTCERVIMRETDYGLTGIHKMVDPQGNVITWFATGGVQIKEGETVKVVMTVKAHNEFKGQCETIVNRVTVLTEEQVAKIEKKLAKKSKVA